MAGLEAVAGWGGLDGGLLAEMVAVPLRWARGCARGLGGGAAVRAAGRPGAGVVSPASGRWAVRAG